MQIRLTLRPAGGSPRDVELRAPAGTTVGDVAGLLRRAAGVADSSVPLGRGSSRTASSGLWVGSRALPTDADLGRVGLRSGGVVGVDAPGPRQGQPHAAVRLHVVSGPDAGRVTPVARGRLEIGRDPRCHVRLNDPDVSRQHAELSVTPSGIVVRDLGSSNGTTIRSATAGRIAVDGVGRELALDSYLTVGETTLSVAGVHAPPAATTVAEDGSVLVNRPPRLDQKPPKRLDLEPDPAPEHRTTTPWVAALVPALGGVGLAWFLHSPQFLAFALLTPLIMIATTLSDRLGGGRLRRRRRVAAHHQQRAAAAAVTQLVGDEVAFRRRAHPDPAALFVTATTPDARLWERQRGDLDFLEVRLGLGDAPARAVVRVGSDALAPALLPGVPAVVSLRDGPLGICGPRPLALPLMRWIIGQLVVLHSPADLRITGLLCDDTDGEWEWLRWLPHARTSSGEVRVARSPAHRRRLLSELSAVVDEGPGADDRAPHDRPWTVVLVDRCSSTLEPGARFDQEILAAGISFVHLDVDARRLPPTCVTIAQLSGETGSRVRIRAQSARENRAATAASGAGPIPSASPAATGSGTDPNAGGDPVADRVDGQWCDEVSRALAPMTDPGADRTTDLPVSVRARDLFDLPDLMPGTIRARWARAGGRAVSPVGMGTGGPVEIDLGRDGPHALVAGTTGAGKSELLQTLVAGLALHSPPAELQFVLIDYKGGAAFGDCARLPHTVGMVTDLDAQLTERALRSLDAELRRREILFARAGAVDLGAYRSSTHHASEPVGRIVLVVDEFASLAEELPEFVTGLVGIAQRGRSLGVHLILATQRPGGVVSPEIRANTALRIALRVTDENESTDVIGSGLAARIDKHLPGRAVVRAGQSLLAVQIARIANPVAAGRSQVEVIELDRWGSPVVTRAARIDGRRTDLMDVVDAVHQAWEVDPVRPRRPWLDPLPTLLDLAAIAAICPRSEDAFLPRASADVAARVPLGLVDRPDEQAQIPFVLDLHEPTTMVFAGGPRSGRTSLLRTAAIHAAGRLRVDQLHIYAIDCSGAGLAVLTDLPHCGAVVGRDAPASIAALIGRLSRELDRRQHGAGRTAPDNDSPDNGSADNDPGDDDPGEPALLLLLDGWEGFLTALEELDAGRSVDTFLHLLRDGAASGLSVVVTGDRAALAARLSGAVQHRFVLRMSDPSDYAVAGLSRRQVPAAMPRGRAVDTADASEIQLGVFGPDASPAGQNEAVRRLIGQAADQERGRLSGRVPFTVRALPTRVHLDDLADCAEPGRVVLGLGGDSGEPVTIRVGSPPPDGPGLRFLVAGPARSGRSTAVRTILIQLAQAQHAVVAAGGARSALIVAARDRQVATLDPERGIDLARSGLEDRLDEGLPVTLLIDDTELFTDTAAGERLSALIHRAPPGLDVVATGRIDDPGLTYRGIAAEITRARTGVLLQPGPGDADLFGLRLAYRRLLGPPGRGFLVAPDLAMDWAGSGAVPVQLALA